MPRLNRVPASQGQFHGFVIGALEVPSIQRLLSGHTNGRLFCLRVHVLIDFKEKSKGSRCPFGENKTPMKGVSPIGKDQRP